jgi:hypothetical protein
MPAAWLGVPAMARLVSRSITRRVEQSPGQAPPVLKSLFLREFLHRRSAGPTGRTCRFDALGNSCRARWPDLPCGVGPGEQELIAEIRQNLPIGSGKNCRSSSGGNPKRLKTNVIWPPQNWRADCIGPLVGEKSALRRRSAADPDENRPAIQEEE